LVGDLNATPEAPEIKTLTAVLDDTWTEVGDGPGYTIEAGNPTKRIDFQLHSAGLRPVRAAVPVTPASDHLPVVASFVLS
ncbi:MAG TPA: endonuclease/exonuclease/phosphatase family protein, partial [Kribbella sp.]|nr:endonuclease/exonuclease/phosphatase family protein [Kribbella sp.]